MISLLDARGRQIKLARPPRRIVSLVPSQTELLSSLGLSDEVVGITRFCVHPAVWYDSKAIVGGTKLLRTDRIQDLKPDLIFANLEENTREDVERIEEIAPVYVTNVRTLEEAIDMIESVALMVGRSQTGARVAAAVESAFQALEDELGIVPVSTPPPARHHGGVGADRDAEEPRSRAATRAGGRNPGLAIPRAAYLIWRDPYMSVGGDTFIHDMMQRGGFENVFGSSVRYPKVTEGDLVDSDPDVVFLSSEPFPFVDKHIAEIEALLPRAGIHLVDGQLFSWYGSRLIHTPDYLRRLRRETGLSS